MQARTWFLGLTLLACRSVVGEPVFEVSECVSDPCGDKSYCIMKEKADPARPDDADEKIIAADRKTNTEVLLVAKKYGAPKSNLADFNNLHLSPDGKTLYFHTWNWATSPAVRALDLTTGKGRFVTAGSIVCVIEKGHYKNDLIIGQSFLYIQGGRYVIANLFDPQGKLIGIVGDSSANDKEMCD